jgi:hypothetical protein
VGQVQNGAGSFFNGDIDDVGFFSTALDGREIQNVMAGIWAIDKNAFYSPKWVDDIAGRALAEPNTMPPYYYEPYVVLWGLGDDAVDQQISWDVNDFSGFTPPSPLTQYQRGVDNLSYGSTAVQLQGYSGGFFLDSDSATGPAQNDLRSGYYSGSFTADANYRPWYSDDSCFSYSCYLQVPSGGYDGGTCGQLGLIMHLTDMSTASHVWVSVVAYDSRGMSGGGATEGILWDAGTDTAIVISYFGEGRSFLTPSYDSDYFTDSLWNNWRYFSFRMSPEHVATWANAINTQFPGENFSTDAADYRLNSFNAGPEIYTPGTSNAYMGCSVKNVWLISEELTGDLNYDGIVNIFDLADFTEEWLETSTNIESDFNNDQTVNFLDFAKFAQGWLDRYR